MQTHASAGHPLFAGAKTIRDGQIEVKLVDRMAALEALGRITGVFERDHRQKSSPGPELAAVLIERKRPTGSPPAVGAGEVLPQAQGEKPRQP